MGRREVSAGEEEGSGGAEEAEVEAGQSNASASAKEETACGPSSGLFSSGFVDSGSTDAGFEVTTTFTRPFSGRNFEGIDSHVRRPMITAFIGFFGGPGSDFVSLSLASPAFSFSKLRRLNGRGRGCGSSVSLVTRRKKAISPFSIGQGRAPERPMPRCGSEAAAMSVRVGLGRCMVWDVGVGDRSALIVWREGRV